MSEDEIIEEILNVICDGGTPVATCDLCKKTWFSGAGYYMEEGELDQLRAKMEAEPNKYAPVESDSVSIGYAFGYQFVWHCKCEKVRKTLFSLWRNSSRLIRAFTNIHAKQKTEIERRAKELEGIATL